ncbi:MAG: hypothetical protein GTN81_15990 [Proteobacteria bacterium]|nr:hypothetical protein [Pseudomonadota bacterium]
MQANLHRKDNIYPLEKPEREDAIIEEVRKIAQKYHIDEIIPVTTGDISVAKWVQLKCKYGCNKYGTNWCCPPETPTSDQAKALLSEYKKALLLCGRMENNQFYRDNQKKRRIQVNMWKGTVALERHLFLRGYYKAFGLVSESCALCRRCTYPDECVFPADRRPSVESWSIDIFQTLKNIGKPFKIARDVAEEYPYYSLILLE